MSIAVEGEYFKTRKNEGGYEVYFPGEFTLDQPWGAQLEKDKFPITDQEVNISIRKLAHITHYSEAEAIVDSKFEFKSKEKRDPYPNPYSYKCIDRTRMLYKEMPQFLSGYFSWWSIDSTEIPPPRGLLSPSRQFSRESNYGKIKFSIKFDQIEKSYIKSYTFSDSDQHKILYKRGGTLRYKKEVCYVIIVCIEINGKDPFPELPTNMTTKSTDTFLIKRPSSNSDSWDTYAFAFHFPTNKTFFLDPQDVNISAVKHPICLKTIREKLSRCPDEILSIESCIETLKRKQRKQRAPPSPSSSQKPWP